jgi:hypothetical protein
MENSSVLDISHNTIHWSDLVNIFWSKKVTGYRVKAMHDLSGQTLMGFNQLTGILPTRIALIEYGKVQPTEKELQKFAQTEIVLGFKGITKKEIDEREKFYENRS